MLCVGEVEGLVVLVWFEDAVKNNRDEEVTGLVCLVDDHGDDVPLQSVDQIYTQLNIMS